MDIKRKIRCRTQVCEFSGEILTILDYQHILEPENTVKLLSFLSENVNIIKR